MGKESENPQIRAALEVHHFFSQNNIPYVIIGGLAVQRWGEPRFTLDVDVTILARIGEEETVVETILAFFQPRIAHAKDFALKNRVCLVKSSDGYNIDISLGLPGYEEEVIKRAVKERVNNNFFYLCSPEDLIIHKAVTGRAQDIADLESIILRQQENLDLPYIRKWLSDFSKSLEDPEIQARFEWAWANR